MTAPPDVLPRIAQLFFTKNVRLLSFSVCAHSYLPSSWVLKCVALQAHKRCIPSLPQVSLVVGFLSLVAILGVQQTPLLDPGAKTSGTGSAAGGEVFSCEDLWRLASAF